MKWNQLKTKQKSQDHEVKNTLTNLRQIAQMIHLLSSIWT